MTCIEAQKRMTLFMEEKLDTDTLTGFLEHIRGCKSCREDLEVYYTLFAGMKLLDEDRPGATGYNVNFEKHMKKAEDKIRRKKRREIRKRVVFVAVILFLGIILL